MKRKKISLSLVTLIALVGFHLPVWGQDTAAAPTGTAAVSQDIVAQEAPLSDSARKAYQANAAIGRSLFMGTLSLENGGPSCISCHNAKAEDLPEGGLLAKDLTHVYARLGSAGIPAILGSTPFPAMASAYKNKPMTTKEINELTAFFQQVEETAPLGEPAAQYNVLLIGGGIGIVIWLGLIFGMYANRKKESVKLPIYARQAH